MTPRTVTEIDRMSSAHLSEFATPQNRRTFLEMIVLSKHFAIPVKTTESKRENENEIQQQKFLLRSFC